MGRSGHKLWFWLYTCTVQWDLMGLETWSSDDHHGLGHLFTRLCGAVINTTVTGIGSRVIGTFFIWSIFPKYPQYFRSLKAMMMMMMIIGVMMMMMMMMIIMDATQAAGSISRGRAWGRTQGGVRHDIQLHCQDHHTEYDGDDHLDHRLAKERSLGQILRLLRRSQSRCASEKAKKRLFLENGASWRPPLKMSPLTCLEILLIFGEGLFTGPMCLWGLYL